MDDDYYSNPIIHADYSDPEVIRVGEDFYMTASSFNCTPGLPILHSRDMVNWTLINHAIVQVPHPRYTEVQPGCGVWAPSFRYHAGKFWIFFPLPDEGIYVTTTTDPAAAWSEPWLLQAANGWIDPCPFWDDDGRAYLVHAFANSRAGIKDRIHIRPMAPDGTRLLGEGRELIHTPHHPYLEGPKVYKRNGWYYILAPGGGVQTGWQVAFRSRNIFGPYEEKIVLEQGTTSINGPHQGALVDLSNGESWFFHFQDVGPYGRIVHLQPVNWRDDWPAIGVDYDGNGVGEPVLKWKRPIKGTTSLKPVAPPHDEFEGSHLNPRWQWHANHRTEWATLSAGPGWLRLSSIPRKNFHVGRAPNFLGQKFPARSFTAETLMDFANGAPGEVAGLAVVGGDATTALALRKRQDGAEWVWIVDGTIEVIGLATSLPVKLAVDVTSNANYSFRFATREGAWARLPRSFVARGGSWIGAKVGLFAIAPPDQDRPGHAEFDWFRMTA